MNLEISYTCPETGLVVVWNGSATFNVYYPQQQMPEEIDLPMSSPFDTYHPVDVFTRCWSDQDYGPPDSATWGDVRRWVEKSIEEYLMDQYKEEMAE